MTYVEAILAMNEGKRVRRHSWESDASIFMSKDNKLFSYQAKLAYLPTYEAMIATDWEITKKVIVRKEFNVFLSLPMHGKTKEEILEEKAKYFAGFKKFLTNYYAGDTPLEDCDIEIKLNDLNDDIFERHSGNTRLNNLGLSIGNMSFADFIIFSVDYSSARGCYIEREVSRKYKKDFGWRVFIANNYSDYVEVDV